MEVKEESSVSCPYLGTIRRHLIDFDLEQVCCVSMSTNNVYVCLVCGKYYQGKGMTTPAF
jgi:U4/U6.U5 tri-snRNP-associated protein 2